MFDLRGIKVLVTGASGFVGKHLMRALAARNCEATGIGSNWDLRDWRSAAHLIAHEKPDAIFHLAARCGGIGANMAAPGDFIMDNLRMGLNVIEAAKEYGVGKLVMVGTICSYPEVTFRFSGPTANQTTDPYVWKMQYDTEDWSIHEDDLWRGYPEPTNAPYGISKRTLIEVGKAYHKQYGLSVVNVLPANMYGPGDNFDPETSHVIPAMIRKFTEAARGAEALNDGTGRVQPHLPVTCWGTGQATRDFLYVEDACEGIIRAAERLDSPEPVNLGTGKETTIRALSVIIAGWCGYRGSIRWDKSKPDGQPRRVLDTTRQRAVLDWMPSVCLDDGLRQTVEWWNGQ